MFSPANVPCLFQQMFPCSVQQMCGDSCLFSFAVLARVRGGEKGSMASFFLAVLDRVSGGDGLCGGNGLINSMDRINRSIQ